MPGPIQFVPTLRSEFGGPRSARARQRAHPSCPTAGLWAYMHAQASTPTACLRRDLPVGAGRRLPCWAAEFADGTHSLEETYQLASTGPENPAETHVMQEQLDRVRLHLEPIEPSARWLRQCNLALRPTAGFGPTQQSLRPDLVVEVGLTQTARGADPTYRARAHQIETAVAQVVLTESVQGQTARLGHRAAVLHDFRHLEKSAGGRFLIPEHSLCTRVNARSGGKPPHHFLGRELGSRATSMRLCEVPGVLPAPASCTAERACLRSGTDEGDDGGLPACPDEPLSGLLISQNSTSMSQSVVSIAIRPTVVPS